MIVTEHKLFLERLRELTTIEQELEDQRTVLADAATDEELPTEAREQLETTQAEDENGLNRLQEWSYVAN
ncbi:hypothetical protein [Halovivax gelatinilyticus]|uniref:hypothetical protein n=1 Tax=Halovivax gelatinilyticus TaxID=2961597 RepID=UPI0020CA611E|nr:hypothetical protein [Halovivax gelatinilyticus]